MVIKQPALNDRSWGWHVGREVRPDTQEGSEDRTSSPSLPQGSPAINGEELEHAAQQSRSYSSLCRFFFFFFAMSYSMWDLNSPPRDGILPPALGAQSCNHWTTGEVPSCIGLSGSVSSLSHECLNVLTYTHTHIHTGMLEDLGKSQVTFVE